MYPKFGTCHDDLEDERPRFAVDDGKNDVECDPAEDPSYRQKVMQLNHDQ